MMADSLKASKAGLAIVDQVRKQKGWPKKGRAWLEAAEISESTLKRFWQGHAIQEKNFTAICAAVGVDWQEIAYLHAEEQIELPKKTQQIVIDWRAVCSRMLPNYYPTLAVSEGVILDIEGLSLELQQGSQSGRRLGQSEFFQEVIQTRHLNMAPWKMAIVGPSGVGKTTLLRKIADWVFQCTDHQVAIWVSLADLGKKNLEDYLLKTWLKDALKTDVTPEMAAAMLRKFQTGQVWLLLDGVSQMDSRQEHPLRVLASQMSDWVGKVRILLTCREDVWEARKNALAEFEVYRYGELNPQQVERYINRWFVGEPQQAKQLQEKLAEPGGERIRDIVNKPLELSLLCCIWQQDPSYWPRSYIELYQQFTMALYDSKQESLPTGSRKRRTINKALAKLALRGLEQPETRFRLRETVVLSELKTPKMLELVQQIGWLHRVGVAAREPVYAFAHPQFQVYFAATEIGNWHLLFEQMLPPGVDRIFDAQWQQVFLLWLGREDVSRKQKEKSLKVLRELSDGWGDVNTPHAYFLVAAAIGQFPDYSEADRIITQLVEWGYAEDGNTSARSTLQQSDLSRVLRAVGNLFSSDRQKYQFWSAVAELRSLAGDSWEAKACLIKQLQNARADYTACLVATTLAQIQPGNPHSLHILTELLHRSPDRQTLSLAVSCWRKFGTGNSQAISALTKLLYWSQSPELREQVAALLADIDPGNDDAQQVLNHEQLSTQSPEQSPEQSQPVVESRQITQEQLIHLALEIQRHRLGTLERDRAFANLIRALESSGELYVPNKYKYYFWRENYDEALQENWLYIWKKIDNYDPRKGKVINWVNFLLRKKFLDVINRYNTPWYETSLDAPYWDRTEQKKYDSLLAYLDETIVDDSKQPSLSSLVMTCLDEDPEGLFKSKYICDRPDANLRAIAKFRAEGVSWKDISAHFSIGISTLSSFYQRCLKHFGPKFREYVHLYS